MLKPVDYTVEDMDGVSHTYTLTRIPATYAREIVANYPTSALPKIGDYEVNEKMMLKLMSYVYAHTANGGQQQLTSRALIDNHIPDWETLAKVEMAMVQHNTSFFSNGKSLAFLENLTQKAQAFVTQILTASSAPSSKTDEQPHTNSERSTT